MLIDNSHLQDLTDLNLCIIAYRALLGKATAGVLELVHGIDYRCEDGCFSGVCKLCDSFKPTLI
jgi:hypothetical protein